MADLKLEMPSFEKMDRLSAFSFVGRLSSLKLLSDSLAAYIKTEDYDVETAVIRYCNKNREVQAKLGDAVKVKRLSGGMCNHVFEVSGPNGKVVAKHVQPFAVFNKMPLNVARQHTEATCMQMAHLLAPTAVPERIYYSPNIRLLVMEFLDEKENLTQAIRAGRIYPAMAGELGEFFAKLGLGTTPQALGTAEHDQLASEIAGSRDLGDMMYQFTLVNPFTVGHPSNRYPEEVEKMVEGTPIVMEEVNKLRQLRSHPPNEQQVLTHYDAWGSNILCGKSDGHTHVVDFEFGALGPLSYDPGHLLGALLNNIFAVAVLRDWEGYLASLESGFRSSLSRPPPEVRGKQLDWLLSCLPEFWESYSQCYSRLCTEQGLVGLPTVQQLFPDVLGFAAVTMVRWTIGEFNLMDQMDIPEDVAARGPATRQIVQLGTALLCRRHEIKDIQEVVTMVKTVLRE